AASVSWRDRSSRRRCLGHHRGCNRSLTTGEFLGVPYPHGTVPAMRNRFDLLAKRIGLDALGRSGTTMVNDPINPETQYADLRHEPDPAHQAERDRLGLLGRIAGSFCLIEVYSEAPGGEEFRACLTKHLAMWQDRARKARSERKRSELAGALVHSF